MPSKPGGTCIHHVFNPTLLDGRHRLDAKTLKSQIYCLHVKHWRNGGCIISDQHARIAMFSLFFSHTTEKLNTFTLYFIFLNHLLTHLSYLDSRVWLLVVVRWRKLQVWSKQASLFLYIPKKECDDRIKYRQCTVFIYTAA